MFALIDLLLIGLNLKVYQQQQQKLIAIAKTASLWLHSQECLIAHGCRPGGLIVGRLAHYFSPFLACSKEHNFLICLVPFYL